jgi:hypothetical protein
MYNAVSLPPPKKKKHQSFRPLKFELAVMEFYKIFEILFTYSDEIGY